MFVAASLPPPPLAVTESWRVPVPARIASASEVNPSDLCRFAIDRHYLALEGGRLLLKLHRPPVLEVNQTTLECLVLGWDIRFPHSQAADVDRAMARKFLTLFGKADANDLSEQDEVTWLSILDQVDFSSFCIQRAAPHYVEGQMRRLKPVCIVDWADGRTERIAAQVATSFSELQDGDAFGAYVKLGRDANALSIERVSLLETA